MINISTERPMAFTTASSNDHFRLARRIDADLIFTGRVWDGEQEVAQLDAYDFVCRHPGTNRLRHSRS
jgi:hypothetical protein